MRMRALWAFAALALVPAMLQAQEPKKDSVAKPAVKQAPDMKIVRLTDRDVNRAMPQLQAELTGQPPVDNAMLAMTRTEYTNVKNALMVARLDFRDPSRLVGPDDPRLDVRRMNVTFYTANESRLEPVVQRLRVERSCTLCGPR